jgi:uncharacterized protein
MRNNRALFAVSPALTWQIAMACILLSASPARAIDDLDAAATLRTVQSIRNDVLAPAATQFANESRALFADMSAGCTPSNQVKLNAAILAWEPLNAVAVGPLIARRSARQIDFRPTRPLMIEEAVVRLPQLGARTDALSLIGTPAKGLPALAWLSANQKLSHAAHCHYAQALSAEVHHEALSLATEFTKLANTPPPLDDADDALDELLNQWLGGLDKLRWAEMEKPLRAAPTHGKKPAARDRLDGARWQAQWQGLYRVANHAALYALIAEHTQAGKPLAQRWQQALSAADAAMKRMDANQAASVLRATEALAALKRLAETDFASALDVKIGFSDADGD